MGTDFVFEAGDSIALDVDVTATGALPAGHVNLEGSYL